MIIAIDFVSTNLGSGTKTYNLNVIKELTKFKINHFIYIFVTNNYYKEIKKFNNKNIKYIIKPNYLSRSTPRLIWMQLIMPFELKILGVKKIFSPMNICPLLAKFLNIKIYLALHSNLPWKYFNMMPGNSIKNYLTKKMMEWSIKLCNKLIVDSYFAKKEIKKVLDLKKKNIKVIYLGCSLPKKKIKKIKKNYILSVLSCVKYHNIINLLKAYKNLIKDLNISFYLVIQILDKTYYEEIKYFIRKKKLNNHVKLFINFQNYKLSRIYANAKLYVFTSYCEVFGLTSLEAMSYGCPVLVSNASALPEINGNAAEYFNPDNIQEITNKMNLMIKNINYRNKLINNSKKHIKKFSWNKTAKLILDTF